MADPAIPFTAIAHPNIALIKYWGKRDVARNLPAVGSLSVTLDGLRARTSVGFDPDLQHDEVILNGREDVDTARRVTACLDRLRRAAGISSAARVISDNDFPTGAGLASSAAGIAALVTAAAAALKLSLSEQQLIDIACLGSGSAPRSLYSGIVAMRNLPDGRVACESVLAPEVWPLSIIIAVTTTEPKAMSSREGMKLSRETSPFYAEWVGGHDADLEAALEHVRQRDLAALGELAEHNCLKMHSVMMTTRPALLYWTAATLACMHVVQQLRRSGVPVFFTVDAGPQVKALCAPRASEVVRQALAAVPGVQRIISSKPGSGARCVSDDE
jgi:diphosphomevalonate decarboxylase